MSERVWDRTHLLGLESLSAADLTFLMDDAQELLPVASGKSSRLETLAGRTVANLFFEDSTRTRCSFVMAARRLGADTLEFTGKGSSLSKGESLLDTARNIEAMGVDGMVIRTGASGAVHQIAQQVHVPVINAGDGRHEHPTQGLLDLLTLRQRFGDLTGKSVAIVGDIDHSRVARSAMHGLTTLGVNVTLVGPPALVPATFSSITRGPGTVDISHDFDAVLPGVDAVMMLRVQFERHGSADDDSGPSICGNYRELYGLSAARAALLPDHAIVMHPGPINRGLELDSEVADDPKRSVILQQVTNGVAVRMAVLKTLMSR